MKTSPEFSKAKIFSCDIALTSLATMPIDLPSLLPKILKIKKKNGKHCDRCKGKTFPEQIWNAYLKSGSARKDAYFNVSLQGTRDRILSSSSTYCNANRDMIEWKLQLKKGYTAQAYFSSKLLKRRHKGNKLTRRKDKH
jgi:hypothetical protein